MTYAQTIKEAHATICQNTETWAALHHASGCCILLHNGFRTGYDLER